jgi:hypothetical protein
MKAKDSIFNKISDKQFNRLAEEAGWEPMPTYKDYYEPSYEQKELDELKQNLIEFYSEIKDTNPEFEETFKKRFKDILA